MTTSLRIGTRGSPLALRQTAFIADLVRAVAPDITVRVEIIKTTGDRVADTPIEQIGGKGVFTKEIETALLEGRVDAAVHSMKDLPTALPAGLAIAAVPPREDPRDVLVCLRWQSLDQLPRGTIIGTSSVRRAAQLTAYRPDLRTQALRGNVNTRLKRIEEGLLEATVMAYAGLARLGQTSVIAQILPTDIMLPAVGQGALAVEVREEDTHLRSLFGRIDDAAARSEVEAERAFLATLGGGCLTAAAALARCSGETLTLTVRVCHEDGFRVLQTDVRGEAAQAHALGREAAENLLEKGAAAFVRKSVFVSTIGPLDHVRVIVTRAEDQADELVRSLNDLGADVLTFPTIAIEPADVAPPPANLSSFDWVVFTSINGVNMFARQLANHGRSLDELREARVCAIGAATARAARLQSLQVNLIPTRSLSTCIIPALLDHDGAIEGKRFLLPRGDLAGPDLPDALRRAGGVVTEWIVYRTVQPEVAQETIDTVVGFQPQFLLFSSSSSAKNFCALLGESRLRAVTDRAECVSIGPATSKALEEMGLRVTAEAHTHDIPGLVQAILARVQRNARKGSAT